MVKKTKEEDNSSLEQKTLKVNHLSSLSFMIILELTLLFLIGTAFQGFTRTITFVFSYFLVFFFPALPLYTIFKKYELDNISIFVFLNTYALMIMPIIYFIIGYGIMPVTRPIYITLPIIVFIVNLVLFNRKLIEKVLG